MKRWTILAAAALFCAAPAYAQDSNNKAAAEALFDEGLALFDKGKHGEACPKFAASYKLDPASGTLLNVGRCYEKVGKTASAWSAYRELIALAHKENNPKREATAKQLEEKIRPRLAKITLNPAPDAPMPAELAVKLDQVDVDRAQLKSAVPIDPGPHTVEASAPGKVAWTHEFKVENAENVAITIPILADAPVAAAPPPSGTTAGPSAEKGGLGPMKLAAIGVGGAGVVGLAIGGVFGAIALSNASTARDHCPPGGRCDAEGLTARDDANGAADVSTIALIAGGVLLAGGVVLWLVAPSSRSTTGLRTNGVVIRF